MQTLIEKIHALCRERNAVILAHNYTMPEVQDVADFVGDSLELSLKAAATTSDIIVFCGVHFMAETAKVLNPARRVLMPDPAAGCPMADMVTADALRQAKARHPGASVVCYVNSTVAVKAESDVCCTSSNAPAVVRSLPADRPVLFVPDRNLADWTREQTGRDIIPWEGWCPTHQHILPEMVAAAKQAHPGALLVTHPECPAAVRHLADRVASTAGMLAFCRESSHREFIIATEEGIIHRLRRENPEKQFYLAGPRMVCPNMKRTTLEKILWCLEDLSGEVKVDEIEAQKARVALERMFAVNKAAAASATTD
jgi:quinolinate synthase